MTKKNLHAGIELKTAEVSLLRVMPEWVGGSWREGLKKEFSSGYSLIDVDKFLTKVEADEASLWLARGSKLEVLVGLEIQEVLERRTLWVTFIRGKGWSRHLEGIFQLLDIIARHYGCETISAHIRHKRPGIWYQKLGAEKVAEVWARRVKYG